MSIIQNSSNLFIGTDIIEVDRIKDSIIKNGQRFLDRLYTPIEQKYCFEKKNSFIHFAGRFAAKEAIIKSLKSSGYEIEIPFRSIEVIPLENGEPKVRLHFEHAGSCKVSISHIKMYAIAFSIYTLN
jgi:holo-[acyl-carrier protein] synthase